MIGPRTHAPDDVGIVTSSSRHASSLSSFSSEDESLNRYFHVLTVLLPNRCIALKACAQYTSRQLFALFRRSPSVHSPHKRPILRNVFLHHLVFTGNLSFHKSTNTCFAVWIGEVLWFLLCPVRESFLTAYATVMVSRKHQPSS